VRRALRHSGPTPGLFEVPSAVELPPHTCCGRAGAPFHHCSVTCVCLSAYHSGHLPILPICLPVFLLVQRAKLTWARCRPRPQVNYKEPTPPDEQLVVRSQIVKIKESALVGGAKATVQVDLSLHQMQLGARAWGGGPFVSTGSPQHAPWAVDRPWEKTSGVGKP
jgi:hypothetical protein